MALMEPIAEILNKKESALKIGKRYLISLFEGAGGRRKENLPILSS